MNILTAQGIGDSVWTVTKLQSVAAIHQQRIDLHIACWNKDDIEGRAIDFLRRFDFIDSVSLYEMPRVPGSHGPVLIPGPPADENGYYRYIPDGPTNLPGIDWVMLPNRPLERGQRLETWLPQYETNWKIMDHFHWDEQEIEEADVLENYIGKYVVFCMGSEAGNTVAGHNRGPLWKPESWVELGRVLHEKYAVSIVAVGAKYDMSYYDKYILPLVQKKECHGYYWYNFIGDWKVAKSFAVVKKGKCLISHQSGIAIVANYMDVPVAPFWRPKGDSIDPNNYVSFEESMASAWATPESLTNGKFLPLIYGRHDIEYIMREVDGRGWLN